MQVQLLSQASGLLSTFCFPIEKFYKKFFAQTKAYSFYKSKYKTKHRATSNKSMKPNILPQRNLTRFSSQIQSPPIR